MVPLWTQFWKGIFFMGKHILKVFVSDEDKRRFEQVRDDLSRRYSLKLNHADVLRILIREEHQRISANTLPAAANG